jgi:hypothetical protein
MNTHPLGRLYDQLTPRERLPLLMAAHLRGDAAEYQRLSASAPTQTFQVADHYPLAKALGEAVHLHLLCLLDLAGSFWQWWGLWLASAPPQAWDENPKKPRRRRAAAGANTCRSAAANGIDPYRAYGMMRYYASRFMAHRDGWKEFCADLHLEPEAPLNFRIGWGLVTQTETAARPLVFDTEEAAQFLRQEMGAVEGDDTPERSPAPVESVAGLVRDWHALLGDLVRYESAG